MSYQGLVAEIPIGQDGFTSTKNLATIEPTQLVQALNLTYESGTIRKEGGSSKYNAVAITGAPSILGGHDWHPTSGTQRMVVLASDGKLYKDSGGGTFGTTLKSGLTVSGVVPVFVEGGKEAAADDRKLFVFTGVNAVQVLSADGATTADLTTPPADWAGANQPTTGCIHEGRLWGFGNANDPHRGYYSTLTNQQNFTGANSGSLSIYPGEGEKTTAVMPFGSGILVAKLPRGIYFIDTSDPSTANWRVNRITGNIGCVGVRAFAQIDRDIIFMDQSGEFHLASATDEFGDLLSSTVPFIHDTFSDFIRDNIALGQLSKTQLVFYEAKRELHAAVSQSGSTSNDLRLVIDLARGDRPRARYSDKDDNVSLWLKRDVDGVPRLTAGDNIGFVWNLDQEVRSKDGVGFSGLFQTPHDDLARLDPKLGIRRKNGHFLEIVVEPKGNWDLAADIYWDAEFHETVTFNMGSTGAVLGSFVIGTDVLAGDLVLNKKRRITGGGRRFSIVGRNSGAGEDFSIAKMYLHFSLGDERL